jgi:hypothetical protein
MDHPEGAGAQRGDRVDFDPRLRLEFRGTQLMSHGGLLVMRALHSALGLFDLKRVPARFFIHCHIDETDHAVLLILQFCNPHHYLAGAEPSRD